MNNGKFTMNALMVIVLVVSAIGMLFTIGVYDIGEHACLWLIMLDLKVYKAETKAETVVQQ